MSKFLVKLQALKLAKEAVDSIENALICEPQNLQGFIVKCKKYELIYSNSHGDFELTVEPTCYGEVRYFIWVGKKNTKPVIKEVNKEQVIERLANFYSGK